MWILKRAFVVCFTLSTLGFGSDFAARTSFAASFTSSAAVVVEPSGPAAEASTNALLAFYESQQIYSDPVCASRVIDGVLLTRCYNDNGNFEGGALYATTGPNALALVISPINGKAKDHIGRGYRWPRGITIAKKWGGAAINIPFALSVIR